MDTKITMGANRVPRTAPEAEVDTSLLKIFSLAFFTTLSAFAFGYFFRAYLLGGGTQVLAVVFVFAIFFASLFLLQTIAVKDGLRASMLALMEGAALTAWFYTYSNLAVFLVPTLLAMAALFYGGMRGRASLSNMMRIHFSELGGIVTPKIVLALAIVAGMSIYMFHLEKNDVNIPKPAFVKAFSVARGFIPEFSKIQEGKSFEEDLRILVTTQAEQQVDGFPHMPEPVRDEVVREGVQTMKQQVNSLFGTEVNFDVPMSEAAYQAVSNRLDNLTPAERSALPILLAAAVLLAILSLSAPIGWMVLFVSYILFEILLMTGFMTRVLEERSREVVILK